MKLPVKLITMSKFYNYEIRNINDSDYIASTDRPYCLINNVLERIRKDATMARFEELGQNMEPGPPVTEQECYPRGRDVWLQNFLFVGVNN
jgi:hypothetical protein